jgi:hypothetical protein
LVSPGGHEASKHLASLGVLGTSPARGAKSIQQLRVSGCWLQVLTVPNFVATDCRNVSA